MVSYQIVNIQPVEQIKASILIIYTGGTFGMSADERGILKAFNFEEVIEKLPELKSLELQIQVIAFSEPIDSSNVSPKDWQNLAHIIEQNYDQHDGFVILHGTDTMAYSASALSFMLLGLGKPVIFTGAQIPIGSTRSDARENLITALEIASTKIKGRPRVSEVCIYFNFVLLRANRSQKVSSRTFSAFQSKNYPPLAESGITIEYNEDALAGFSNQSLRVQDQVNTDVALLKIFPGISKLMIAAILKIENLRGIVMETFGSGNVMTDPWFIDALAESIKRGVIIINVSQCIGGTVEMGKYEPGVILSKIGVIPGGDMTTEATLTKLMILLGNETSSDVVVKKVAIPMNGEMNE